MFRQPDPKQAANVQAMFAHIAGRYDRMNRVMSWGRDAGWRRRVIDLAGLPPGGKLLDIGTGTGDLALEASRRDGSLLVVGSDFTMEMMREGRKRTDADCIHWAGADALHLPFPAETFDAVTSGYLMRNVVDVHRAWAEQYRVLKPGGRVVCLDLTRPLRNFLSPFVHFYLHGVVPALGNVIAGAPAAYRYLPDSVEHFLFTEELAKSMEAAGFRGVTFRRFMFGTMAMHWGSK